MPFLYPAPRCLRLSAPITREQVCVKVDLPLLQSTEPAGEPAADTADWGHLDGLPTASPDATLFSVNRGLLQVPLYPPLLVVTSMPSSYRLETRIGCEAENER